MIIYDDLPEYGRIISYPPSQALAAMVEEDKRLALEAVVEREPLTPFKPDVSANPTQFQCSPSHLDNILMVRDEDLARKAVQTVRAVQE